MPDLSNGNQPRAIVIGAGAGIGRATALELAREGYLVAAISRTESSLASLRDEGGERMRTWTCDITDVDRLHSTLDDVLADFGSFDIAVHSAATYLPVGAYADCAPAEIAKAIELNVTSAFLAAQQLLGYASAHGGGSVALLTSGASRRMATYRAVYSATKAAIDQLVTVVGAELREADDGAAITAVNPGKVDTGMQEGLRDESNNSNPLVSSGLSEFRNAKGQLLAPSHVATQLVRLLRQPSDEYNGRVVPLQTDAFHNPV